MSPRTPTLAQVITGAIENRLADVHVMLPGRVTKYDADSQKVDVQPMIKRYQEAAEQQALEETIPVIPSVPVAFPRGGGFKLTFPIAVGDSVMLVFCEQSTENYQAGQGTKPVSPELFQRFDLTDAVAIPGWYRDTDKLRDADTDDVVLAKDGGAAIHVSEDQVNLYEKSAADFVALAQKVKTELDTVINDINTLKAAFSSWTVAPNDGGAALRLSATSWYTSSLPASTTTGAEKVKAT